MVSLGLSAAGFAADVGGIRVGQPVHFTVDAFPERVFKGSVKQIRLDAKSLQNVVNALKTDEKYAQKVIEAASKSKDGKAEPSIPTKLVSDLKAANLGLSLAETPHHV